MDHLLRNAAVTVNEIRPKIGFFPSSDPKANELVNPNMPADKQATGGIPSGPPGEPGEPDELDTELAGLEGVVDEMLAEIG